MKNYLPSELQVADKLLEQLGVPRPYTLQEEVMTLNLLKIALYRKLKTNQSNRPISRKTVAHKICSQIYAERRHNNPVAPRELCFVDWRDDLDSNCQNCQKCCKLEGN